MNENTEMSMRAMRGLSEWESDLAKLYLKIFKRRNLTAEEADAMHTAIRAELEKENDRLKVKAELFALLFVCQPEALFRRRRLTDNVVDYTKRLMGQCVANTSAQKQNISFLYFNDKTFRAIAMRAVEAATNAIDTLRATMAGMVEKLARQTRH